MDFISNKLNEITTNITNNVQTQIMDKISDSALYVGLTLWQSVIDVALCILLIDIYWCCFCLIMNRDKVYIPPFGDAKPLDNLFFIGSFFMVIRLIRP